MNRDPIEDFLDELYDLIDSDGGRDEFDALLREHELMIVPINDPENLFGIMEDSLG